MILEIYDLFKDFLAYWGKQTNDRIANKPENLEYLKKYSGRWVNVGDMWNEDWQWIENDPGADARNTRYISVFHSEDDNSYKLVIAKEPIEGAIYDVDCISQKEIDLAIGLLNLQFDMRRNFVIEDLTENSV